MLDLNQPASCCVEVLCSAASGFLVFEAVLYVNLCKGLSWGSLRLKLKLLLDASASGFHVQWL